MNTAVNVAAQREKLAQVRILCTQKQMAHFVKIAIQKSKHNNAHGLG
jgi:hypothetical protein